MTLQGEGQYYRQGSLFERVREYWEPLRLPAPDKRPGEQGKNHDGPDQNRFWKTGRPASEQDPEHHCRNGEASDQALGHAGSFV